MGRRRRKGDNPVPRQPATLRLQIATCGLASLVFLYGILVAWLAYEPYSSFLEFISTWKAVGTVLGLLSAIATAWAFVLGWDPKSRLFERAYARVFSPLMRSRRGLQVVSAACGLALAAQTAATVHLLQPVPPEIESSLHGEYDAAAGELKALPDTDHRKRLFLAVNEALLQETLRTSASANPAECQQQMEELRSGIHLLEPLYQRYLRHRAEAACSWVARNPGRSAQELDRMIGISRFLSRTEAARARLAKATLYTGAPAAELGLRDEKEARVKALEVLSDIDLPTKGTDIQTFLKAVTFRMQGNVSFLSGNYGEANDYWTRGIQLLPEGTPGPHQIFELESVRLRGNRVLALAASGLSTEALAEVDRAKNVMEAVLRRDTDAHRATVIRVYSNGSIVAGTSNRCELSSAWWKRREEIKKQDRSACTALLETVVLACGASGPVQQQLRSQILGNLAFAAAGTTGTALPDTLPEQRQLLDAGVSRFARCYSGLTYPKAQIAIAMGLPAQ